MQQTEFTIQFVNIGPNTILALKDIINNKDKVKVTDIYNNI